VKSDFWQIRTWN